MMQFFRKRWPYIILVLFILIGGFFRFWDLANTPPGVYPDEAKNANDAIDTIISGEYEIFYPENNGREGPYIWLLAAVFQIFGIGAAQLKLVGAIAGTLTILGAYLMTKEIMRFADQKTTKENFVISAKTREVAALLAAGFTATSFWHINFSRIGFRAILVPMLLGFAMYFLLKAYRQKSALFYILAGITWGAGIYTYIAFRIAYLIPLFFLATAGIFYLVENKPKLSTAWLKKVFIKDGWWKVKILLGLSTVAVMAPMLLHFYNNPGDFISRASGISVLDAASPVLEFFKSLAIHLQSLFFVGDGNWRHNFSREAQLFWPVAILFAFGFWYSLRELINRWKIKNWSGVVVHATLGFSLFAMVLPAALTLEGIPHALRAIGMIPFVFVYAAFGFVFLVSKLFPHTYHREEIWPFSVMTVAVIVLLMSSYQFTHYFIDWGQSEEVGGAFSEGYVDIGNYFNSLPTETNKVLIVNGGGIDASYPFDVTCPDTDCLPEERGMLPMSAQTTLFIQRTKQSTLDFSFYGSEIPIQNTNYVAEDNLFFDTTSPTTIVPMNATDEIKNTLRMLYPLGSEAQYENFWAWEIR